MMGLIRSSVGFGVYSDGHSVYLAEVRQQFGVCQLVRYASERLSDPADDRTPRALAESLSAALTRSGIARKGFELALCEKDSVVRSFEMPVLPRREWKRGVKFEAQKYVPFDLTEVYIDFKASLDRVKQRLQVFFAATRIQSAERLIEAVESLSMTAASAEPASVSLARLLQAQTDARFPDVYAVLDRGDTGEAMILLVRGNKLRLTRSFSLVMGGDSAIEQQAFLSELRLSLNYFSKSLGDEKVSALYLLCDSEENIFIKLLRTELEIPAHTLNPLKSMTKDIAYSSGLAIAAGAALKPISQGALRLNLISARRKRAGASAPAALSADAEKSLLARLAVSCGAAVLAVLILLRLLAGGGLARMERSLESIRQSMPQTPLSSFESPELTARSEALRQKLVYYDGLITRRVPLTEKLNELARLTPEEIKITVLSHTSGEGADGKGWQALTIQGGILSVEPGSELALTNRYVASLKESPVFMRGYDQIKISSVNKASTPEGPSTQFSIVCSSEDAKSPLR